MEYFAAALSYSARVVVSKTVLKALVLIVEISRHKCPLKELVFVRQIATTFRIEQIHYEVEEKILLALGCTAFLKRLVLFGAEAGNVFLATILAHGDV